MCFRRLLLFKYIYADEVAISKIFVFVLWQAVTPGVLLNLCDIISQLNMSSAYTPLAVKKITAG